MPKVQYMSCENGIKVITIVKLDGMPVGSVLQNCIEQIVDGEKCWSGLWCSMHGSYFELVKQEDCEIYNEEKHDPLYKLKIMWDNERLEAIEAKERATLARLKLKYEGV